jgi:hypothetical protein
MKKENKKTRVCIVKQWTDKINGNTYHKIKLFLNGDILESDCTYGYGNQYEQTVYNLFNTNESWKKNPFRYPNINVFLNTIHFEKIQVNTKTELKK